MDASSQLGSNACAALSPEDREALRRAAVDLLDARGLIVLITEFVGRAVESISGSASDFIQEKFGLDVKSKAEEIGEAVLWQIQSGATIGMDAASEGERWNWFHKLVAVASGASAGFVGAPGLLWDLPVTTGIIMRSIADIARSYAGENLDSDDTKRACIEVFAFGGPERDDDDVDAGYWAVRSGLTHATIGQVIRRASARFGVALSDKAISQAVPLAGILAGGGLNYVFIGYYQQMARVHFAIRNVERRSSDPSAVHACFSEQVRKLRNERKARKP